MSLTHILIALVLLLANGFFVASEFALIAARRTQIEHLAQGGSLQARWALDSVRELSLMLAGAQLGITMASLGLGHVAEPAVAQGIESLLHSGLELPAGLSHSISFVLALSIVVFLHMVVGEMAPKNIAIAEPERSALILAVPFRSFVVVFRPVIWLMNRMANRGLKIIGVEPRDELIPAHSAQELGVMIRQAAREGALPQEERRLLSGAAGFSNLDAGAVMIPRTEVVAVPLSMSTSEAERTVIETGHSRLPVYEGDLDHVVGFLHAKDLIKVSGSERDRALPKRLIRHIEVVPESKRLHPLLVDMRRRRQHLALVVEEHGGTAGIVTMEDVLEELVGEIRDEYDLGEGGVARLRGSRYMVPGTIRVDELEQTTGIDIPPGEYETIAGFLMDRLGRVPRRQDVVTHEEWVLRILSMHRRRVVKVLIERLPQEASRAPARVTDKG